MVYGFPAFSQTVGEISEDFAHLPVTGVGKHTGDNTRADGVHHCAERFHNKISLVSQSGVALRSVIFLLLTDFVVPKYDSGSGG